MKEYDKRLEEEFTEGALGFDGASPKEESRTPGLSKAEIDEKVEMLRKTLIERQNLDYVRGFADGLIKGKEEGLRILSEFEANRLPGTGEKVLKQTIDRLHKENGALSECNRTETQLLGETMAENAELRCQINALAKFLLENDLAPKADESACEGAVRVIKKAENHRDFFHSKLNYAIKWISNRHEKNPYPEPGIKRMTVAGILELLRDWKVLNE